jgi:hypothetical protein
MKPLMTILALTVIPISGQVAMGQQNPNPLLYFQRSNAYLETVSAAPHAQGMWGVTLGNPGDVSHYPNAVSCLLVYGDGRYIFEKTEERTVGKRKSKRSEGTFSSEELQQLKSIINDEHFRKITTQPMPNMPDEAVAIKQVESWSAQVDQDGTAQQFTITKQLLKTNRTSGMDDWLDNSGPNEKLLSPFLKWFKEAEKKGKAGMKESTAQYCRPMVIG